MIFLKRYIRYIIQTIKYKTDDKTNVILLNSHIFWEYYLIRNAKRLNTTIMITIHLHNIIKTLFISQTYKIIVCSNRNVCYKRESNKTIELAANYYRKMHYIREELSAHDDRTLLPSCIQDSISNGIRDNIIDVAYIQDKCHDIFMMKNREIISLHTKVNKQIQYYDVIALFCDHRVKRLILNNTSYSYQYAMDLQDRLREVLYYDELTTGDEDLSYTLEIVSLTHDKLIIHQKDGIYKYQLTKI